MQRTRIRIQQDWSSKTRQARSEWNIKFKALIEKKIENNNLEFYIELNDPSEIKEEYRVSQIN